MDKAEVQNPVHMDMTLFYASPEKDADLLYLGGFHAPDPFLAFEVDSKKGAVLSSLELNRGRKESRFDEIFSLEELRKESGEKKGVVPLVLFLAGKFGATRFRLPEDFPAKLAFELSEKSDRPVIFVDRPVCRDRLCKTADEQESIRRVNEVISGAFGRVEEILAEAVVDGGILRINGKPLTSEWLRSEIAVHCLRHGCIASGTIAAGGEQACDPHEQGSGPLPAHELIIVDIFPRDEKTGFFGDMTRTYLKGKFSAEQRRLVETVREAQALAIHKLAAGVDGKAVHDEVTQFFDQNGFPTGHDETGYFGFFHGTGHGLGLEIHEEPRVGRTSCQMEAGMVTTVEPGLYYPGLGGCRIEDVVRIGEDGVLPLSSHPYDWVIA